MCPIYIVNFTITNHAIETTPMKIMILDFQGFTQ